MYFFFYKFLLNSTVLVLLIAIRTYHLNAQEYFNNLLNTMQMNNMIKKSWTSNLIYQIAKDK